MKKPTHGGVHLFNEAGDCFVVFELKDLFERVKIIQKVVQDNALQSASFKVKTTAVGGFYDEDRRLIPAKDADSFVVGAYSEGDWADDLQKIRLAEEKSIITVMKHGVYLEVDAAHAGEMECFLDLKALKEAARGK